MQRLGLTEQRYVCLHDCQIISRQEATKSVRAQELCIRSIAESTGRLRSRDGGKV